MTKDELNGLLSSERPEEKARAVNYLVRLLTSEAGSVRARGHELLGEAFNDALYRSCLNYRGLVGGFTHPLVDAIRRTIETWAGSKQQGDPTPTRSAAEPTKVAGLVAPASLRAEHDGLHRELAAATRMPGQVGEAAREAAELLHPHFLDEEAFALPPLGLLAPLARGEPIADPAAVTAMTDHLGAELPRMLAEHRAISAALRRLADAALAAGDETRRQLAEKIIAHAQAEEEVMYPAAMLVGAYLHATAPSPSADGPAGEISSRGGGED